MIYAIGGGLLEVLVSPVVESCPSDNKEKAMSMLHSFYCWGHVGVVLISTVFFSAFGITNWKILAVLWGNRTACECRCIYKSTDPVSDGRGRDRAELKRTAYNENILDSAHHDDLRRSK